MNFEALKAPRKILVATDLSARSERALQRAVLLAGELGASLEVFHVVEDTVPASVGDAYAAAARETIARLLAKPGEPIGAGPNITLVSGQPYRAVLEHAHDRSVDLIVLGITRHSLLALFTGTTAERIIRVGELPVLMVRDAAEGPYQRVLVATDTSPSAARALFCGLSLAPKATFCLLHAAHVPFKGLLGQQAQNDIRVERDERFKERLSAQLKSAAAQLQIQPPDILVAIEEGDVAAAIREKVTSFRPQLLVLGTHGRTAIHEALIGSLAQYVLSDPPCDVLVAKA